MRGKLLGLVAATALLVSVGVANAKEPVQLSDHQLDKVTAGAANVQIPVVSSFVANGAGGGFLGGGGINQFSPSTATVTQTVVPTSLNLFTIH